MDMEKAKVFISYSHNDRSVCESIVASLEEKEAYSVWYDKGLIPGEEYRSKIAEEIRNTDFFIVLISERSVCSEWVLDEVEYAKKLHKKILPIWIEDTTLPHNLDMILQRYHSLFWHLRTSDDHFMDTLCASLSQNYESPEGDIFLRDSRDFLENDTPANSKNHTAAEEVNPAKAELLLDEDDFHDEVFVAAYEDYKHNRFDSAFHAFSQLASQKNAKAQLILARMYAHGLGTEKSAERADFWYSSAAKLGDVEAQYVYGAILTDKPDPDKKKEQTYRKKGMALLKKAADRGYKAAMEQYISESAREPRKAAHLRCAIDYCNQLIERSKDPYEHDKYTKAKRELILQQVGVARQTTAAAIFTACYIIGMIVCFAGTLYLLAGMLPDLYAASDLLQKLPNVTEELLLPVPMYWDWVFTFLNLTGSFGLELILLGEAIRSIATNRRDWNTPRLMQWINYIFYAWIAIWYCKFSFDAGILIHEETLKTLCLVAVTVFVSVLLGYILGAILSGLVSAVFPTRKKANSQ